MAMTRRRRRPVNGNGGGSGRGGGSGGEGSGGEGGNGEGGGREGGGSAGGLGGVDRRRDEAAAAVDAECSNAKHRCGSERTQQPVGLGPLLCGGPSPSLPGRFELPRGVNHASRGRPVLHPGISVDDERNGKALSAEPRATAVATLCARMLR